MRRAHLARTKKQELRAKIEECTAHKKRLVDFLQSLKERYLNREITYLDYSNIIRERKSGRTIPEWIEYYDVYIDQCRLRIKEEEKKIVKSHFLIGVYLFLAIFFFLSFLFLSPKIIGFVVNENPVKQAYINNISLEFNENQDYSWSMASPGQLLSLKISGELENSGEVKVYLDNLLILDSQEIQDRILKDSQNSITGRAIAEESASDSTSPISNDTLKKSQQEESLQKEVSPSQGISPAGEKESLNNSSPEAEQDKNPSEKREKKIKFENICKETCDLKALNLTSSSYTLRIEVANSSLLLERIDYEILSALKKTAENATEISGNATAENISEVQNIKHLEQENKAEINETKSQIVIGKPVKWKKHIKLAENLNFSVTFPSEAENISVKKLENSLQEDITSRTSITGNAVSNFESDTSFLKKMRSFFKITGRAVDSGKDNKEIIVKDSALEYEIEYETPAPEVHEIQVSKTKKRVTISAPESLNYTDVLSFTNLSEEIKSSSKIVVYWIENNSYLPSIASDTNQDGFLDYVEWVTPHLSNQTFEIIIITKAEHLNSSREVIEDIYESVKSLDNIWSPEIPSGDFVRVKFEIPLDRNKDISIYPRAVSGNPIIKVYEINKSEVIAEFYSINSNEYNKVFLSALQGQQDTFDLLIEDGSVEFDHIIDPILKTLVPSNITQRVTRGALTENTFTFSGTQVEINQTCYTQINVSLNEGCINPVGSTALDAYFLWNITFPFGNTSINWIFFKANFSTYTANGTDSLMISGFNWSNGRWYNFSTQKPANITINYTLSINLTGPSIGQFVNNTAGNLSLFMVRSNGTGNFDTDIKLEYMEVQVSYNGTAAPIVNLTLPVNNSTTSLPSFTFNASYTDDTGLSNTTFSIWNSSSLVFNTTIAITGLSNSSNITFSFPRNDTYFWNYQAGDLDSNYAFNKTNYTFVYNFSLLDACMELSTANAYYTVMRNLTDKNFVGSGGFGCFNITRQNVTLDCQGFYIQNGSSLLPAIYSDQVNTTIKNCNINVSTSSGGVGITFFRTNNSFVQNTTFQQGNISILLNTTSRSNLTGNTYKTSIGVLFFDSSNNTIANSSFIGGITGVYINNGTMTGNLIINNTFSSTSDYAVNMLSISSFNSIINNTFISTSNAIKINGSSNTNITISGNNIHSTSSSTLASIQLILTLGSLVRDNIINGSSSGAIRLQSANSTIFTNNNLTNNLHGIIIAAGSSGNNFSSSLINGSVQNTIIISGAGDSSSNLFENITIVNRTTAAYDLNISLAAFNKTYFRNTFITNYTINGSIGGTIIFENTTHGKIEFISAINGSGNFSSDIIIKNNSVFVNSSKSGLNKTANITLYNLPTGFSSPVIKRDDLTCPASQCANSTSLNAGTVKFNVSSWSNYSIVETAAANSAPQIVKVDSISAQSITEDSVTNIVFNFTAFDADGSSDLKTGLSNFTRPGEAVRFNSSCSQSNTFATNYANYSCTVQIWYFDQDGAWNVSVSVNDSANAIGVNITTNFSLGQTSAFVIHPASLTWASIAPGAVNQTSSNDPLVLNNTGNKDITVGNIQVNSTDLVGEADSSKALYARNFTVGNNTGSSAECDVSATFNASILSRAVFSAINLSNMSRGNHSADNGVTGQERLYFCIRSAGSELSAQAYSTTNQGSWTVKILGALLSARTIKKSRKKKRLKDDNLLQALELIAEELRQKYSLTKKATLDILIDELKNKYGLSRQEITSHLVEKEEIPISIFASNLGALEALCRFLKENKSMQYSEIASLISRDDRTIWTAYKKSLVKQKEPLDIKDASITVPLNILKDRRFTVLESLVVYLKEEGFSYAEIANLINRDQRNIWTIYSRANKKMKKK